MEETRQTSILKMKAACTFETSKPANKILRRQNLEDLNNDTDRIWKYSIAFR
jgi:hypothetical protein